MVNISEIYDQFSFGEYTPLAVYRFMEYVNDIHVPDYLFMIGKGLYWFEDYYRDGPLVSNGETFRDLIPAAGFPGSDMLYTAGDNGAPYEPLVSTSRLTARSPDEVAAYLEKVREMEATPFDALWRKDLIHLSGGQTEQELNAFRAFVESFETVAESDFLGGFVTTQSKQSKAAVELINIAEEVNQGVSLITFFGHSAPTLTDIDIGNVSDPLLGYDNAGRYPTILVNGCNAGNIFATNLTFGEDWMNTAQKGSIAFTAHVATGFASDLKEWSDVFYAVAYADSSFIDQAIGDIHREVTRQYIGGTSITPTHVAQAQQMILQGDPAVRLFGASLPDYAVEDVDLFVQSFDGSAVTALTDSFQLGIIVRNFGRTDADSIAVTVNRVLVDGTQVTLEPQFYDPVLYQDTLYYTLFNTGVEFGINQFMVELDPTARIPELDELNNSAILNYFIPLGGSINLFPTDFGIVSSQPVELIAQNSNVLAGARNFIFELDTSQLFNSPFRQTQTVNEEIIATASFTLLADVPANDSTVYYWRSRFLDPQPEEDTSWTQSSFTYIQNSPDGWSQSDFPQFDQNPTTGLTRNAVNESWEFTSSSIGVSVTTFGTLNPMDGPANISVIINNVQYIITNRLCQDNSFNAIAFDKSSTVPYVVLDNGDFDVLDRLRCGRTPQVINSLTNFDIRDDLRLEEYIDGVIDGDFVVLFSIGQVDYQTFPASTFAALEQIGVSTADMADQISGYPLIILGKKGDTPGSALLVKAPSPQREQEITMNEVISGFFTEGNLSSPRIGPALSWTRLLHDIQDKTISDTTVLDLYGVGLDNEETLLFQDILQKDFPIDAVDATAFPFLRLNLFLRDSQNLTPAQLRKWLVIYDAAPEGVLLSDPGDSSSITLAEGEEFSKTYSFYNVSEVDFVDSLLVRTTLFNETSRTTRIDSFRVAALPAGDSIRFTVQVNTTGLAGVNSLTVFVNPFEQTENNYDNNVISLPSFLNIEADTRHPVLEVTFDGAYILDGDIVSVNPMILIRVRDQDNTILKTDTAGVSIFLKPPGESSSFERIDFDRSDIQWTPETNDSDFQVEFTPQGLQDGIYTLQVQAADAAGNLSGTRPYIISFEVVNETTITHFYPYPNPFSTSTRFVFTLTGSEIPDQIKIQIMTVTGKVVREITQDEIGPIRIGNNMTDYAWDGRDEFGDQLANGVYLYKVFIRQGGEEIRRRETSADRAFKKGFGKIYLLR